MSVLCKPSVMNDEDQRWTVEDCAVCTSVSGSLRHAGTLSLRHQETESTLLFLELRQDFVTTQ